MFALALVIPMGIEQSSATEKVSNIREQLIELFAQANTIQDEIIEEEKFAAASQTEEQRNTHLENIANLNERLSAIDEEIQRLSPISDTYEGQTNEVDRMPRSSSGHYVIVDDAQIGCNNSSQTYNARATINTPTDTSYWAITYTDPLSIGVYPACWGTSFYTYEVIVHNFTQGWLCASNNIVDNNATFQQTCTDRIMHDGDLVKFTTIAHYSMWNIERDRYLVL